MFTRQAGAAMLPAFFLLVLYRSLTHSPSLSCHLRYISMFFYGSYFSCQDRELNTEALRQQCQLVQCPSEILAVSG